MANAKETIKQISKLDTVESIKSLIEGDDRKSVLDFASKKIAKLSEANDEYFDDVQESDNSEEIYPEGSSLGHVHDRK